MFFVGQQVVCINASNWPRWTKVDGRSILPKKGSIYTVRAIAPRIVEGHDEDGLFLGGIVNPIRRGRSPNGVWKKSDWPSARAAFGRCAPPISTCSWSCCSRRRAPNS
jgi:hypothetical protein